MLVETAVAAVLSSPCAVCVRACVWCVSVRVVGMQQKRNVPRRCVGDRSQQQQPFQNACPSLIFPSSLTHSHCTHNTTDGAAGAHGASPSEAPRVGRCGYSGHGGLPRRDPSLPQGLQSHHEKGAMPTARGRHHRPAQAADGGHHRSLLAVRGGGSAQIGGRGNNSRGPRALLAWSLAIRKGTRRGA